jgi:transcriptional regulator with PAS, ATPase and Fis domain
MHNNEELLTFKIIAEGTSSVVGKDFLKQLVKHLAEALNVTGVWVTEFADQDEQILKALAFWINGKYVDNFELNIKGTPCETVVADPNDIYHIPDNIIQLYPDHEYLPVLRAVSFMGIAIKDVNGKVLGSFGILDDKPMPKQPRIINIFKIFAARAGAEMQRLQVERQLQESEQCLKRLINGTQDAIIELDELLQVTQVNDSAKKLFNLPVTLNTLPLKNLLSLEGLQKITNAIMLIKEKSNEVRYQWLQEHVDCVSLTGKRFPAEATITECTHRQRSYYILILRDLLYKIECDEKIKTLSIETQFLREEIKKIYDVHEIVGSSPAILKAINSVRLVAPTDATVLLAGETGTGKELFARAIHNGSSRKDKPMVKLNCAALPANLIESELFGHEKGSFTGATVRREGRFALANNGSIFLDEIGEFPLELQAKLLRVLQEGEFEPIGSNNTVKVNVRVIAATNRDLMEEVRKGRFREDLYYRLNVYPVHIPPLRERGDDIIMLADKFLKQFSNNMNKRISAMSENDKQKIMAYHWPGNVRELQNVMERVVITAEKGRLNIYLDNSSSTHKVNVVSTAKPIITASEWKELEKENILKALEYCKWKISGPDGAAALLDMPATTLSSKLKALGVNKFPSIIYN